MPAVVLGSCEPAAVGGGSRYCVPPVASPISLLIVAGQELVKEGDLVKPVEADQATISKLIGEATAGTQ